MKISLIGHIYTGFFLLLIVTGFQCSVTAQPLFWNKKTRGFIGKVKMIVFFGIPMSNAPVELRSL